MISRFTASRSAAPQRRRACARSRRTRPAGRGSGSRSSRLRFLLPGRLYRRLQRELLLRIQQPPRVEHDDGAPILHDEAGDVLGGEALHDGGRRRDLCRHHLQHLGHRVHDDAELRPIPLEDDDAGLLAQGGRHPQPFAKIDQRDCGPLILQDQDRKSTRLNSSHSQISYAVFCLKKKIHDSRLHTLSWYIASDIKSISLLLAQQIDVTAKHTRNRTPDKLTGTHSTLLYIETSLTL